MTSIPAFNSASAATPTRAAASTQATQPSSADVKAAQAQLDAPDPTYPALSALHVGLLQAMGTPADVIAGIAARKPDAAWLDSYIQDEIMQNPEGWDDFVKNPRGTTRAGILQVFPDARMPAPGTGSGTMPSDSGRVAESIPGTDASMLESNRPRSSDGEKVIRAVVWGAVAIGAGLLAWHFIKGRGATEVAKEGASIVGGGGGKGFVEGAKSFFRGGGKGGAEGLAGFAKGGSSIAAGGNIASMGMSQTERMGIHLFEAGLKADNATLAGKGLVITAAAERGSEFAAMIHSVWNGAGPINGHVAAAGLGSIAYNAPLQQTANIALDALRVNAQHAANMGAQLASGGGSEGAATQLVKVIQRIVT